MSDAGREFGRFFNNRIKTLENQWSDELNRQIRDKLIIIGEKTVQDIQKYLQKEWYDKYKPKEYDRTYSLKRAVRYTIIDNKSIKIYFDRRRFGLATVNGGVGWQPHRGFDGVKFVDGLIDFIADGIPIDGSKKNPRYNDKINYGKYECLTDYMQERVNKYINDFILKNVITEVYKTLPKR